LERALGQRGWLEKRLAKLPLCTAALDELRKRPAAEASDEPTFAPVKIKGGAASPGTGEAPAINIFIGDIRVRVTGRIDCGALRDVFAAARAAR
jgi:hypothetical protein